MLQVGPGPGYVPVTITRSSPDLSRASSGQDERAERSHAGYIHVSLRNLSPNTPPKHSGAGNPVNTAV